MVAKGTPSACRCRMRSRAASYIDGTMPPGLPSTMFCSRRACSPCLYRTGPGSGSRYSGYQPTVWLARPGPAHRGGPALLPAAARRPTRPRGPCLAGGGEPALTLFPNPALTGEILLLGAAPRAAVDLYDELRREWLHSTAKGAAPCRQACPVAPTWCGWAPTRCA